MNFSRLSFGVFHIEFIGLFWALAFAWFAWQWYHAIQREKLDEDFFVHHFWRWGIAGILLGRLVALCFVPSLFQHYDFFSFFAFWEGGINAYGFLLGFLGFMAWDISHYSQSFWRLVDLAFLPLLKALMLMDLGFFLTGSIYGTETSLPWGVRYETFGVELITPVHPVTIYGLILHFILYQSFLKRQQSYKKTSGKLFCLGLFWIIAFDVLLQWWRFDETLYLLPQIRVDQVLGLVGLVVLFKIWTKLKMKNAK